MKKTHIILVFAFCCSNALASESSDLENKLPITYKIASDSKKSGICLAANRTIAAEKKSLRDATKKANGILLAAIEEKQGKSKVTVAERIASEWASAMNGNTDWAIRQMESYGCSEMNDEIGAFLQK